MSLRIAGSPPPVAPVRPIRTGRPAGLAPTANDQPSIGPAAELDVALKARQALRLLPSVRDDRVAAARQRLSAGTYTVQAEDLALRILSQ